MDPILIKPHRDKTMLMEAETIKPMAGTLIFCRAISRSCGAINDIDIDLIEKPAYPPKAFESENTFQTLDIRCSAFEDD